MREIETIYCSCGGKAERVKCSDLEMNKYNCHRCYECCVNCYECKKCKTHWTFALESPEY